MSGALYRRNIAPDLDAAMADIPVVAVVGPRQCGKSTLVQEYMEDRGGTYVSLDDAGRRAAANDDPTGFVEEVDLPFAIDEFQKAPALLDAIKLRVDRERRGGARPAGMFLLTGSANVWATLRISESMAGRAERIQLWPLSQGEIEGRRERFVDRLLEGEAPRLAGCKTGRAAVSARLTAGGYPEMLVREDARRRARWARNYVEMVVERDAHDLTERGRYLDELPRLLELAAARVGGLLETTAMGNAIGMKKDTVRRYLALLELLYLVRRAPAWSRNLGQRLVKSPKLWMPDTGLACELLGYSQKRFETDETAMAGALFENFVAGEIAKQATWSDAQMRLHHFRTAGGREVDVVVEATDGRVAGIEVKLGATPSSSDFRGLAYLRDKLGDRFAGGVVVGTGAETLSFGDRLWSVPVSGLWE